MPDYKIQGIDWRCIMGSLIDSTELLPHLNDYKKELSTKKKALAKYKVLKPISYFCAAIFYILNFVLLLVAITLLSSGWWLLIILFGYFYVTMINHMTEERTGIHRFLFEHCKYDIYTLVDEISHLEYLVSCIESGKQIDRARLMINTHAHSPDKDLFGMG